MTLDLTMRYAHESDITKIAEIYTQAFPESVEFYFGKNEAKRVQNLMVPSFLVLKNAGAKFLVFGDPIVGYCCYSVEDNKTGRKTFSSASLGYYWQSLKRKELQIHAKEIWKLMRTQYLMKKHYNVDLPKNRGRILSVAILPEAQSQGIGKLMLDRALLDIGDKHVVLEVRPENEKAYRLYKSAGFRVKGSTRDLLGCWLIMVKNPKGES